LKASKYLFILYPNQGDPYIMSSKKRSSRVLEKAQRRLTGVQSIDEQLALGQELSTSNYSTHITTLRDKLNAYNKAISDINALRSEVDEAERFLAQYSEQILMGIGGEFGKDSREYEKAGGVRTSDRKRPTRKVAAAVG
jgi:hypothetical protein